MQHGSGAKHLCVAIIMRSAGEHRMPEAAPFPAMVFNKKLPGILAGGAKECSSSRRSAESTQGLARRFVSTIGIFKTHTSVALGSQAQAPQHQQGRVHTGIVAMIAIIAGKTSFAQKRHSNQKAVAPEQKIMFACKCKPIPIGHPEAKQKKTEVAQPRYQKSRAATQRRHQNKRATIQRCNRKSRADTKTANRNSRGPLGHQTLLTTQKQICWQDF